MVVVCGLDDRGQNVSEVKCFEKGSGMKITTRDGSVIVIQWRDVPLLIVGLIGLFARGVGVALIDWRTWLVSVPVAVVLKLVVG